MNNIPGSHEPTPEFHSRLKANIAREYRSDELFGSPPIPASAIARPRRLAMVFGIAAGVMLTLGMGIILGASASYAAAATPSAPRSAFAILPIKDALNAIGCSQAPRPAAKPPVAIARTAAPTAAVAPESAATAAARVGPDRAFIAGLATEHQRSVVLGDTAAEYIVMVLDAAEKYAWSTHGSGNLSIQIGGDSRTATERVAHMREHRAEYMGAATATAPDAYFSRLGENLGGGRGRGGIDSALGTIHRFEVRRSGDSVAKLRIYLDSLVVGRAGRAAGGGGARGGGGGARGAGGGGDSAVSWRRREVLTDSLHFALRDWIAVGPGGGGRGGAALNGVSPSNAADGSYKIGWGSTRVSASNAADGLDESGNGQSGIQGVPATSIAMGESYVFPAGELAPQLLRIVVVHLTPGTAWKGR